MDLCGASSWTLQNSSCPFGVMCLHDDVNIASSEISVRPHQQKKQGPGLLSVQRQVDKTEKKKEKKNLKYAQTGMLQKI